jgi:error-prone DNA polymerase
VLAVHPLALFTDAIRALRKPVLEAAELPRHVGRSVWVLGWPITRKEVVTRAGEPMEFVSFEDQTAIYETIFFPQAFQRFCQYLDMNRPYLLFGKVESEFGALSLTVRHVLAVARQAAGM